MSMDFSPGGLAFLCREQQIRRHRYTQGENIVGAQETESCHQAFLVTMGMFYIVIHFLLTFS